MQNINEFPESQKLIDKVHAWEEQGDWKKIIDEFGTLKPEDMPIELSVILANAYITEANKNNERTLYEKAIYTLTPLAHALKNNLQFNRIMGIAFLHLDLYG
ncbi:MAG: hypothetical protein LUC43_08695, partial [Burkholderiales bacterium]|nr:hypothetical protein [Burkholderiales bacterium]